MQACPVETNFTQFDHISKAVLFPKLKLKLIRNSYPGLEQIGKVLMYLPPKQLPACNLLKDSSTAGSLTN